MIVMEKAALMEPQYHDGKDDIETSAGLPPSKGAMNTGVVDLRAPFAILLSFAIGKPFHWHPGTAISECN